MGEVAENCSRCGKPRERANALIKYQERLICDGCIIVENKKLLSELEKSRAEEALDGGALEEGEEGDFAWSPYTGFDTEEDLDTFIKRRQKKATLKEIQISPDALSIIPRELIYSLRVLPIRRDGDTLTLAVCESSDEKAVEEVSKLTGLKVKTVSVDETEMEEAIDRFFNI